jgi:hypothetical protein
MMGYKKVKAKSSHRPYVGIRTHHFVLTGVALGITAACMLLGPAGAAEPQSTLSADAVITASSPVAIVFMISILALKITAFVLGYLIVRLGHDTLVKGVTGEIDFGFSGSGFKAKLKAASPGALFVLMGAAIILWGLAVQKPFEVKAGPAAEQTAVQAAPKAGEGLHRAKVPD